MQLKSLFNTAAQAFVRFIDRQELKHLETRRSLAQAGYIRVGHRVAIFARISPMEARATIHFCNKRISEIQEKHGWSPKP